MLLNALFTKYLQGDLIKEVEMCGTYNTWGAEDTCFYLENLKGSDSLGGVGLGERIILKGKGKVVPVFK
jgi:hypothetical protein